ncbi:MAG: type II toxin-antitoxin system RelE/ParE family toxin [Peptococcaceae bacterium]|nr:type II toxin-antitoxin system RelE/ParE family toxin [Peptococcaceae bacterium]
MVYDVHVTDKALRDIDNIYLYVTFDLNAPLTATKLFNYLWEKMHLLDELPERYPLYEGEPWRSRGMRVLPTGNFLIFYIPYLEKQRVDIMRVIYGKRNIPNQLKQI